MKRATRLASEPRLATPIQGRGAPLTCMNICHANRQGASSTPIDSAHATHAVYRLREGPKVLVTKWRHPGPNRQHSATTRHTQANARPASQRKAGA